MTQARCRSCGAPVFWAVTENERRMPVDALPTTDGTLAVVFGYPNRSRAAGPDYQGERFTSHFATCPDADRHRRE